jgi:hypothetical protein
MARKKAKPPAGADRLQQVLEEIHATEDEQKVFKRLHRSSDPLYKRAFRIHRHLLALEAEILENAGHGCVSLDHDPRSNRIVLTIRNDDMHCCRFAYLNRGELKLLERKAEVAKELRSCPAYEDVA